MHFKVIYFVRGAVQKIMDERVQEALFFSKLDNLSPLAGMANLGQIVRLPNNHYWALKVCKETRQEKKNGTAKSPN